MQDSIHNEAETFLTGLAQLDRATLAKQWMQVFGHPAPQRSRADLLCGALAWHYQMSQLSKSAHKDPNQLIRKLQRKATSSTTTALPPGSRLLREWQGQTHHVTVLSKGFEYNSKTYRSLTAIACQITGTQWSGPQFFGLRS